MPFDPSIIMLFEKTNIKNPRPEDFYDVRSGNSNHFSTSVVRAAVRDFANKVNIALDCLRQIEIILQQNPSSNCVIRKHYTVLTPTKEKVTCNPDRSLELGLKKIKKPSPSGFAVFLTTIIPGSYRFLRHRHPPLRMAPGVIPFMSLSSTQPQATARSLRILVMADLGATPQRIAQLSQWLSEHNFSFTIDSVLVIGVSRPPPAHEYPHQLFAEQGNDSATIAELEQICPRVVYVPGLHETSASWDTRAGPALLSSSSVNAISGPVYLTEDLIVVHRRYADGLTEKPVFQLPSSWKETLYAKLRRPVRFRQPLRNSAIVLSSSELPNDTAGLSLMRTVRSLLHLKRSTINYDLILVVAPPKMQRVPSASNVFKSDLVLDPGRFVDGYFCIIDFKRPDIWDPEKEPEVQNEQLDSETAWDILRVSKYNMDGVPD
ncbi:unnamed protein product [Agarophyton chilense]